MSHPMTTREWVPLLYFFEAVSSIPMTNREWVTLYFFVKWQSHQLSCVFYTNRRYVCKIAFFLSHPLHHPTGCKSCEVFYKANSLLLILWPTESEWHTIFPSHFSSYGEQIVSQNAFFHQTISFYIIPWWLTGSAWYSTSKRLAQYILLHEQQEVSGIAHYVQSSLVNPISLPIESQSCFWHNMLSHFMPQPMFGRM